jgi:hypothetical protein
MNMYVQLLPPCILGDLLTTSAHNSHHTRFSVQVPDLSGSHPSSFSSSARDSLLRRASPSP